MVSCRIVGLLGFGMMASNAKTLVRMMGGKAKTYSRSRVCFGSSSEGISSRSLGVWAVVLAVVTVRLSFDGIDVTIEFDGWAVVI